MTIAPGGRHPVLTTQHPRPPSPPPEYWACIDQKDTAHPLNQNRVRFYSLGEFNTTNGELCGSSTTNTRSGASLSPAGPPVEAPDRSNLNRSLAQPYAFGGACVRVGIDYHGGARGTLWCRSTILRASRQMPGFHSRPDVGDAILDRVVHNAYRAMARAEIPQCKFLIITNLPYPDATQKSRLAPNVFRSR
jgi:hypothetical protein